MFFKFATKTLLAFSILLAVSGFAVAQGNQNRVAPKPAPTPPRDDNDDEPTRVSVEEIQLNVTALNDYERFDPTLVADDLMVVEDRVPHPVSSIRRVPASVLVILDTGGEMRIVKNLKTTNTVAANFINSLQANDSVAVLQYNDKAEILVEWTNKTEALGVLASKTNFGRRSQFVEALRLATRLLNKREPQNRHLVLITDGLDSGSKKDEREAALRNLMEANVSVHILSYTQMEQTGAQKKPGVFQEGDPRPRRVPEEHKITLPQPIQDIMNAPRLGSINTDRAWLRKQKEHRDSLKESQKQLTDLAADTGGVLYLPDNTDEMIEQSIQLARMIDSQYVATYIPKRSLADSRAGEVREIGVVSRRVGLQVKARRKFVVPAQN